MLRPKMRWIEKDSGKCSFAFEFITTSGQMNINYDEPQREVRVLFVENGMRCIYDRKHDIL